MSHSHLWAVGNRRALRLPPPTIWETVVSSLRASFAILTNPTDRDAFQTLLDQGIIQDAVLRHSQHDSAVSPAGYGAALVLNLFDSLHHNPLWRKHGFDASHFLQHVGPALTNLHDLLFQLQEQEMATQQQKQKEEEEGEEASTSSPPKIEAIVQKISQVVNEELAKQKDLAHKGKVEEDEEETQQQQQQHRKSWEQQAEEAPDSLAGAVSKMLSPAFFDRLYFTSVFESSWLASTLPLLNSSESSTYVPGSTQIGRVALLRARALQVEDRDDERKEEETNNNNNKDYRYEELQAGDPDFQARMARRPVAAQIDVLFEIKSQFRESTLRLDASPEVLFLQELQLHKDKNNADDGESSAAEQSPTQQQQPKLELVEYTRLGVAVLEGWLHHETKPLQWRVPLLRDPVEFHGWNDVSTTVRTVIDESSVADKDDDAAKKETNKKESSST